MLPDYGTSETYPEWRGFVCSCGPSCRGQLRWDDYRRPEMQAKYAGHFLQHVDVEYAAWRAAQTAPETLASSGVAVIKDVCVPSLHANIVLASSGKGGGRGLFAKARIAKDEVVWHESHALQAKAWPAEFVAALPSDVREHFLHFAYCT